MCTADEEYIRSLERQLTDEKEENAKLRSRIKQLETGYDELRTVCNRQQECIRELGEQLRMYEAAQKAEPGIHYCGHCGKPCRCEDDPWVRQANDCDCNKEDSRLEQENAKLRERIAELEQLPNMFFGSVRRWEGKVKELLAELDCITNARLDAITMQPVEPPEEG